MARNNYSLGLVLIVLAIVLLLGKLGVVGFLGHLFWPIFVFLPGLLFHILYFGRILPVGVLVPGAMLITYSILFFYCNIFGWSSMAYLWPIFIFGVAVGLYELHIYNRSSSSRAAFTAACILAAISLVFFVFAILFTAGIYVIAFFFIAIGLLLMLKRRSFWR